MGTGHQQPDKAGFVLEYLAKTLQNNGNVKQKDQGNNDGGDDGDNNQKTSSVSDKELLKFYLHQYRARIHIMSRSMKACKREIKSGWFEELPILVHTAEPKRRCTHLLCADAPWCG